MAKRRKFKKSKLYAMVVAAIFLFCLVIELGQYVPSLGIPDWDELFTSAGLSNTNVIPEGELSVCVIDVGNADCILIRQGEAAALIDAGERGDSDYILGYLHRQGVTKLDLVIATHPHADHIGGMTDVINTLPIERFVMSFMPEEKTPTSSTYLNMLTALDDNDVAVEEARVGTEYTLGTATLTVLAPLKADDEANNVSVVTRLVFGEHAFLFMGDAETEVEKQLLSKYDLSADVLKVGHHGSNTSSSKTFLTAVRPDVALIPCGKDNSYDHPSKDVLTRLDNLKTAVYRSDVHGCICVTSDGKTLSVSTEK